MSKELEPKWILPANIPFSDLKAKDLEECVYWLLDAMGARDLEWRIGGAGGGSSDGGRDLEAVFHVPSPDGELEPQRWWIECKGRKGTVEPEAVKSAALNSQCRSDLAYIVVVTNTTFSNPTREWVKEWQENHPRPRIKLWDKASLERMLSREPAVVLRLFAEALSTDGKLEATRERFWNKVEYTAESLLEQFWTRRSTLKIGPLERIALIANELAHGSLAQRPWAASADRDEVIHTLQICIMNIIYLVMRSSRAGIEQTPITGTIAHLVLMGLRYIPPDKLANDILSLIEDGKDRKVPEDVVEYMLGPIMDRISSEMAELCSADCKRLSTSDKVSALSRSDNDLESYWYRFQKDGKPRRTAPERYLIIESHDKPCNVGFALNAEIRCPLYNMEPRRDNLAEFLTVVQQVLAFRLAHFTHSKR